MSTATLKRRPSSRCTSPSTRHLTPARSIHAHPPIATALACVIDELPLIHYGMLAFGGTVRVAPYATFGSDELAEQTVTALRERNAALMANHGMVTFAPDLTRALDNALLLEWACEVYWRASDSRDTADARRKRAAGGARRRRIAAVRHDAPGREMSTEMRAIALGVHVLDVLVRPVEAIPEGQGGQLVEEIRITAAGTAAGTAITLAKLGAHVQSAGAVGTDALGDTLIALLNAAGVDTRLLLRRNGDADLRQRAPDPARRLAPGLPRRRGQRHAHGGRRAV